MYSDPRWSSHKGNAAMYHRETAGQGQKAQFQGVVVPISGNLARRNVAYQTNNQISAAYTPDNVFQVNSARFLPVQMAPSTSTSSKGVPSFHKSGIDGHAAAEQQAKPPPPLDYQLLLLSLAEDYFAAAHSISSLVVSLHENTEMWRYYKLIATGLGCLEAVLKHWRMKPHVEASVRLRYATVLYEETENTMEAEEALSKGITICERHRLFDLKYNKQHLLARVLYKENSRASLKFLDGVIKDVEAYQHVEWAYAFRFLRVFLCLDLSTHQDILSALSHLSSISAMASTWGDNAILAFASVVEALIHLRETTSAESIEQAQRALAVARSSQLDPVVGTIPQLVVLTHFADLSCTLGKFDSTQAMSKMQAMQATLEHINNGQAWTEDGSFSIPIAHPGSFRIATQSGIIRSQADEKLMLMFNWMPKDEIYVLGFLLSSIAIAHRNSLDGQKAEQMLQEGIRMQERNLEKTSIPSGSISAVAYGQELRQILKCHMQIQLTFLFCSRTSWPAASSQLTELRSTASSLPSETPESIVLQIHYLSGIIAQGTGHLTTALSIFLSPSLSLSSLTAHPPPSRLRTDLATLSALNTILIIRSPHHPQHHLLPTLLSALHPLCTSSSSPSLTSAYNLILATTPLGSNTTIVRTKQNLQSALQAAKSVANNQLMCMTLNFMSWKFFKGVVGEQAEKSARASQTLAAKGRDVLWGSVAAGVLGDTLEVGGRGEEAEKVRGEGLRIASGLPEEILKAMEVGTGEGKTEYTGKEADVKTM